MLPKYLTNISQDFERMNVIHRYVRLSERQHNMLPFPRRVAVKKPAYRKFMVQALLDSSLTGYLLSIRTVRSNVHALDSCPS